MINRFFKALQKTKVPKVLTIDEQLKFYLKSIKNDLSMILLNQGILRDSLSGNWITLSKDLKCSHTWYGTNIGVFVFTYFGKIILRLHLRTNNDNSFQAIYCHLPESFSNFDDYGKKAKQYEIFSYSHNSDEIEINHEYDMNLMLPVIQKCFDLLYKKAVVKNEIRLVQEELKEKEKTEQRKIDINRRTAHVKSFAVNTNMLYE
jgi:hypothetical protein